MPHELEVKSKIALELLAQGAEEVSITGTDIKVVRKLEKTTHQTTQSNTLITVNANATENSSVNISAQFNIVKEELRRDYGNSQDWSELQKKIEQLEEEIKKPSPNKSSLKQKISWLLNFGWDVFAKVAPIILKNISIN
jgi:predicted RNase H-like nuclease (RuvC/YqgF family)